MLKIYPNLLKIIVSAPPAAHMPRPRLCRRHALHSLPSPPHHSAYTCVTRPALAASDIRAAAGTLQTTHPAPLPTAVSRQAIKHARRRLIPSSHRSCSERAGRHCTRHTPSPGHTPSTGHTPSPPPSRSCSKRAGDRAQPGGHRGRDWVTRTPSLGDSPAPRAVQRNEQA